MIMSAFYNTILRQREHSNKWPTTFRLLDMNCTSKAKFTANSADFYQTCYFQLPVTPPLFLFIATQQPHISMATQAARSHEKGSGLSWLASGRSHVGSASTPTWHTAFCHMVPSHTSCRPGLKNEALMWAAGLKGTNRPRDPCKNLIHGQNGTESDVTAAKWKHEFLYSHTCLFPVM